MIDNQFRRKLTSSEVIYINRPSSNVIIAGTLNGHIAPLEVQNAIQEIQNKDGGWPLSNGVYINSDLTTSVYIANLFENFLSSKITNHDLEKEMGNMQYYTLDFLKNSKINIKIILKEC